MGRRKKLPQISVTTVPNGYVLKIEGHRHEYMYFTPDKLLAGVMVHLGLKMTDQLSQQNIDDFIDGAINWHDTQKCIKEIQRLKASLSNALHKISGLARRLIDERRECISLRDDLSIIKEAAAPSIDNMLKELSDTILKKHKLQKPLTLDGLGITSEQITDEDDAETEDSDD